MKKPMIALVILALVISPSLASDKKRDWQEGKLIDIKSEEFSIGNVGGIGSRACAGRLQKHGILTHRTQVFDKLVRMIVVITGVRTVQKVVLELLGVGHELSQLADKFLGVEAAAGWRCGPGVGFGTNDFDIGLQ